MPKARPSRPGCRRPTCPASLPPASRTFTTTGRYADGPWAVRFVRRKWDCCRRRGPNFRALPIRDGRAYAQLDLTEADSDVFIGHPLVADNPAVKLLVNWQEPGLWFVEAHNPTDAPLTARLASTPEGPLAHFPETVVLPPGSSKTFSLRQRESVSTPAGRSP